MEQQTDTTTTIRYTPSERARRIAYVQEYLKDYDSYSACIRMGFEGDDVIMAEAKEMNADVLVNQLIAEFNSNRSQAFDTVPAREGLEPKSEDQDKQQIVSALFREAFYTGSGASHSARITALTTLAKIHQLDKPKPVEQKLSTNVMIVPAVGDVSTWENNSIDQQLELKNTVRE